ncbi:ROK family protein [Cellulomonas cellasea]|uniref:ROK family transcriptional regulator n=2 Tax=Cellulomonas cellasea TaxID=43670 RepID=A0A0A0BDF4_9CELL|nr:ROK family protein [Cellulomonas cellasea]KGM03356.1 ROK family transcriptional regulator [Cellulomonas cellasea DSM 20118]GEA86280.1 polyphosphate glucokinase [Cellulomonas cellasea]
MPAPVAPGPGGRASFTLAVDCGGGGIKASVLDAAGTLHAPAVRVPTPYPLPPDRPVETIASIADGLPRAGRATVGMPGMVRHGVVVATPHYVTRSGPHTRVDPDLVALWSGCDIGALLEAKLGMPTLVLNDAEVHGAGVVSGTGVELVLTLGTGLGSALFDGGVLAPHLELSHAPVRRDTTYDSYIGQIERARLGNGLWSRRVRRVVDGLRPVFLWDRLYLGGGNARQITPQVLARLGDDVVVVPNQAGIVGGVRAWDLRRPD